MLNLRFEHATKNRPYQEELVETESSRIRRESLRPNFYGVSTVFREFILMRNGDFLESCLM